MIDYMHHSHIYDYAKAYINHFGFYDRIQFNNQVCMVEALEKFDASKPSFKTIGTNYDKLWKITVNDRQTETSKVYITPYCSICTGHHGTPRYATFAGQETFGGEMIHSVKYKNATHNNMIGKKVLLVGIGNSSVDVADNLVTEGK